MSLIHTRVIGTGNAWPVLIGSDHKFYNRKNINDIANTAFSIYELNENKEIEWEVLIDAGHGAPQYFLKNHNRIPEAIILTHPHFDHTAGIDWFVQSYYRVKNEKPYSIYCTRFCWDYFIKSYPHLEGLVKHKELIPGEEMQIKEANNLKITSFPAYHGENAPGASMILATIKTKADASKKIIFTGDILCPLLRKKDYITLQNPELLIADSNNRFPYPNSNHWSIVSFDPENKMLSDFIKNWLKNITLQKLTSTHLKPESDEKTQAYFAELSKEQSPGLNLQLSINDFSEIIHPKKVGLTHYAGMEDKLYNNQEILSKKELKNWCTMNISEKLKGKIIVLKGGDILAV